MAMPLSSSSSSSSLLNWKFKYESEVKKSFFHVNDLMSTEKFVMDNFLSIVATVFVGERRSVCAFQI